jgi:ribose/xylose/arabinose/galactoside ABC-type transport system permease subunit
MSGSVSSPDRTSANTTIEPEPVSVKATPAGRDPWTQRLRRGLSFRNIGAVYVWLAIVVVFAFWVPDTFLTGATAKQILNDNAATGLMALSLIIPLCTRTFDLSVGFVASLTAVTSAYMIGHGLPVVPAVLIAIGAALVVGLVNATVVVKVGVDSFIATLATGSLIEAFITLMTDDIAITDPGLAGPFSNIGQANIGGITLPVFYVLIAATAIWFLLEHTATGRKLYATGFNAESARLAGVNTVRLRFSSLVVSALLAGVAGVVIASTVGSGDPSAGTPYLLPAYAAAFLGASQLHPGRFNAWGALIAVLLLGTGITGLGLAAAPNWAPAMFTGVVLIAALAITGAERRALGRGFRRRFGRNQAPGAQPSGGSA